MNEKVGIYVDASNISANGGKSMRYDILRDYCMKDNIAVRMNTYLAFDEERAREDLDYRDKQENYFSIIRNYGFKVNTKAIRRFTTEEGVSFSKANADMDMAVDMILQCKTLDRVILLTGDGDFTKVVTAMQNMGTRVEVIAFRNVSHHLRHEADLYTSGYIIPNLVPMEEQDFEQWGEMGSRVRGVCYSRSNSFAFLRFMDLDFQPYEVFLPFALVPQGLYIRLGGVYDFVLEEGERGLLANDIRLI